MDFIAELSALRKKFKANQNGIASELMKKSGIEYSENYGLSLFQIKRIAGSYKPNQIFAEYLWSQSIREAKLLSFYLTEPEKIGSLKFTNLVNGFNNPELVEHACMILLPQVLSSPGLVFSFCQSDSQWVKMTGYLLLARLSLRDCSLDENNLSSFFEFVCHDVKSEKYSIRMAISRALQALAKSGQKNRKRVEQVCEFCKNSNNNGAAWIAEEVNLVLESI